MKKLTIEFIREQFEKEGYQLLSKKYINSRQKIKYSCPRGHRHSITWGNWHSGHGCPYCANRPPINIKRIKIEFGREGYRLLSKKYINCGQKLKCICSKGHRCLIRWDDWKQGIRCCHCGGTAKKDFEFIKSEFEKEKYKMLSTRYVSAKHKLEYICSKGHNHHISWDGWHSGHRCPTCFKENNFGSNNPAWKGGISFDPYSSDFNGKLKKSVVERDKYKCQNPSCWKTSSKLAAHHIDYDKENCDPSNLITLCVSCNSRANKNREYWTKFYQNIMNKKILFCTGRNEVVHNGI